MSGPPNKRLKSDAPLSPINDQREEELERLSTGQQTRLAKIIEAIIPSRLSQDDEVRAALDKPSEKIFQFNLNVKDDLIRELKTAPDGIGRLQHSFKRKGMQAVEISADSDTQHRFSLFKSLSLLLTGNETKVMRLLIDAAVSYMWKQQQQYSTPTMISWTTNHPPVGLLPTSNFVKYLSYLSEGKAFPYYPVLQALASCLNLEIWVWNLNSQYQRSFHVFSSSEAQPARTLFLGRLLDGEVRFRLLCVLTRRFRIPIVRERLHNDHSNYRPILPVDLGDEEPQAGPSQSFSQIQADLEGPRPNGDQVLDLPGIGRKRVDDVLNEFWPLEDDQGFFVRVTQEGDEYVARKYRGRRQDRLVESAVFPKRFNVDFIARAPSEPVRRQTSVLDRTRRLRSSSVRKTAEKEVKEEALPKWLDLELLPLLQSLGVSVSSFKEKVYADGRLDQADFASLADHDAVVDVLNKEVADKLSAYVHHRIPVVLAGETKAGKSTTINKIIQSTLISEDDWQQTIASLPDFVDSGLGSPIDDEDERYISYEGDPEDVLPSSTKPTTTRHAQIVEASRGIVAFTVTFWDINELDAQLSLVEACFATAREYWEDDEERQGDIFAAVKEEFEKNDQIRLTAAELVSMLGLRRDSDLWKLEKIDLPEKLRTELTSKPTKKTCFFRKDTLAESLQAMHNEYLRLLVDDDHLNGFLKTAIIQIPLRYCLRLIDVPGLQERDPYGYGIAIRALKGGYGDFDTMLFVFGDSLPSADVTFALRQGRLGSRMMERDLQIIDFMPVDKAPAFSTPKKQQEKKGKKLEVHIRDQSREHEDYLLDIICRDQGSGICSELLDITDEERARREDLVRMGIRHLAVNVLLENPEAQVGSVESLVDVLVQFTGHKWKESVAALYRQAINELSVITRLLFNFAAVGSEETVRTLIYHIKSLAETYGRPNVIKAVKNQIEGPLTSTWDAKAIKRVSDPIIDVCDRPRMMSDEFSDLRAACKSIFSRVGPKSE